MVRLCATRADANIQICRAMHRSSCIVFTTLPSAPHFPEKARRFEENALFRPKASLLNDLYCSNCVRRQFSMDFTPSELLVNKFVARFIDCSSNAVCNIAAISDLVCEVVNKPSLPVGPDSRIT